MASGVPPSFAFIQSVFQPAVDPPNISEVSLGSLQGSRVISPLTDKPIQRTTVCGQLKVAVERHRDYYFEDGNVTLQVEDLCYKLHRSLLERHSPFFRELFTMPQPQDSTEGVSDDNPIFLSGIQAINFTRLLWLIYPPVLAACKVTTVDEWMSIFEQADRWQMDQLRDHALNELRALYIDPILKIIFWTRYDLPAFELIPTYMDIIARPQSLSVAEAQALGVETSVKIAQARDMAHGEGVCRHFKSGSSVKTDRILANIIQRVFGLSATFL